MSYVLSPVIICIISSVVLWSIGRRWTERTWLYFNYFWLATALFSIISVIPLARELGYQYELMNAEKEAERLEREKGRVALGYLEWATDLKHPDEIAYFGPIEYASDATFQKNARDEHKVAYAEAQMFIQWAYKLQNLLIAKESEQIISSELRKFQPSHQYVRQIRDWTETNIRILLQDRKELDELRSFVSAAPFKRFTLFSFMILLPLALGIPIAHNTINISRAERR